MANTPTDGGRYNRVHLFVSSFKVDHSYSSPNTGRTRIPDRVTADHALKLRGDLAVVRAGLAQQQQEAIPGIEPNSTALKISTSTGIALPGLEKTNSDIRIGNVRRETNGSEAATLVLPRSSVDYFSDAVDSYSTNVTSLGYPARQNLIAPIEKIELATLESFWTDVRPLPVDNEQVWWECWCWPERVDHLVFVCGQLSVSVSEQRINFPEMQVVPIYCTATEMARILYSVDTIGELRYAQDSPYFYTHHERDNQHEWVGDMSERLLPPTDDVPYVCVLDTGVNRAHELIEPLLHTDDMFAYDSAWNVDDHYQHGHGTQIAGLCLYGNLEQHLGGTQSVNATHRLESVKIVPPLGYAPNSPRHYGLITQGAMALPEIQNPSRRRSYCLAISNDDVSGERSTSWSAALDQAAAGITPWDAFDDQDKQDGRQKRLIFVAAGNIPNLATLAELSDPDEFPIEDPAQAWNVLTIGGYTDKVDIQEPEFAGYKAIASVGETSPYSRASTDWRHGSTPIKPELVFEAGNKAVAADLEDIAPGLASLSLLSTGPDVVGEPLVDFYATSAAVAQAANFAANIQARYPDASAELVRALMVHSASWSPAMQAELDSVVPTERKKLLRRFGYGIPNLARALSSANNDLALVSEAVMKPYQSSRRFNVAHFFELPWPTSVLENLNDEPVQLKVSLSYFVEPNPGQSAPISPSHYRSCGLRFANKRVGETVQQFERRVNLAARTGGEGANSEADSGWYLGARHFSAGSLHCDIWNGRAIELADRKHFAITPVLGWWRERIRLRRFDSEVKYALIVSLSTASQEVDLYGEILSVIEAKAEIEI